MSDDDEKRLAELLNLDQKKLLETDKKVNVSMANIKKQDGQNFYLKLDTSILQKINFKNISATETKETPSTNVLTSLVSNNSKPDEKHKLIVALFTDPYDTASNKTLNSFKQVIRLLETEHQQLQDQFTLLYLDASKNMDYVLRNQVMIPGFVFFWSSTDPLIVIGKKKMSSEYWFSHSMTAENVLTMLINLYNNVIDEDVLNLVIDQ